jgi:hypothetical protein
MMPPKLSRQIAQFVRRRGRQWRRASFQAFRDYFNWYFERGLLGLSWRDSELACVLSMRCFDDYADLKSEFVHNPFGVLAHLRCYGALEPKFIAEAAYDLERRHDPTRLYLWHRSPDEEGPPRVCTPKQLMRMFERLSKL